MLYLGLTLIGNGVHDLDTPVTLGVCRAIGEVKAATRARVLLGADGFGADLTGEVDLHDGVYGDHIVVLLANLCSSSLSYCRTFTSPQAASNVRLTALLSRWTL